MRGARGYTLIEILVALALGAVLGLLVMISFSSLASNGLRSSDTAQMQTNARVSMTLLADDLSRAGFMMNGPSGQNRCARLLTYNSATSSTQMVDQWPVSSVQQTTAGLVPGTTATAFGYAAPGGAQTDAVSIFYEAGFGLASQALPGSVLVVKSTNGTLNNAALFVANTSVFSVGDVDVVVLPSRNICIRMQITGTGGAANNIVHNSGQSPLNPPNGFNNLASMANPPISPALSAADLAQSYVQDFGQISGANGPLQVTYSVRYDLNSPTTPDLWRTVVNALGTVVSDAPVATNVVMLHALFAPLVNGQLGSFVPWSTIQSNSQQGQVGAVEFAYVQRKPNTAKRTGNPATLQVLDETYTPPAGNAYQYQVFSQTVFLRNTAWNLS